MSIRENKYHSTVKLEFRDLVDNIVSRGRSVYHVYVIHRLLSLGLLVDFTYQYIPNQANDNFVYIELDLQEFGKVRFQINTESNYGSVADELSMQILRRFLDDYDVEGWTIQGARGL
jgi:hypothetical protein